MNKKIIIRVISIVILISTFFIIFKFSAQDGEESGGLSRKITVEFINRFSYTRNLSIEEKEQLIEQWHPIVRKLAHLSIYTIVGMCSMTFMCTFSLKLRTRLGTCLLVGMTYAITDEWHQSFVPRKRSIYKRCLYRYNRSIFRIINYFRNSICI